MARQADRTVTERSHEYWSGRAPEYSELHEREIASARGEAFARWVDGLPCTGPGVRALDLACGSGFVGICLARAGCNVTGVDFSAQMLEQARANASAHGVQIIDLLQMDAHDLAFPDETFDLVMTRNATWVLQNLPQVYAEVLRVLRPGGTFVNADAAFGRAIVERMRAGIEPAHPTQTLEQLHERDAIVQELPQSYESRPLWDIGVLWELGFESVACHRSLDRLLAAAQRGQGAGGDAGGGGAERTGSRDGAGDAAVRAEANTQGDLFVIEAVKGGDAQ